nr:DNA (cytosine-5)-methyltransferase CMT3-like [Tanacetum cinerariifolium]
DDNQLDCLIQKLKIVRVPLNAEVVDKREKLGAGVEAADLVPEEVVPEEVAVPEEVVPEEVVVREEKLKDEMEEDSVFVEESLVADDEARRNWPYRYLPRTKKLGDARHYETFNGVEYMQAKKHYTQALVDGRVHFKLGDDGYVQ